MRTIIFIAFALFILAFPSQILAQANEDIVDYYSKLNFNDANVDDSRWSDEHIRQSAEQMYADVMQMVTETYERTYAENMAIMEQIIANVEADAERTMQALLEIAAQSYANALAQGYSNVAAQQVAVGNINSLVQTNASLSALTPGISLQISNNWPNGGSYYYQHSDGSTSNWGSRY